MCRQGGFYIFNQALSFNLQKFIQRLIIRAGHAQLFFESAIAIPQLVGSTSAIAIPQLFKAMLIRNRNSAIANFSEVRNFKSAT
jgi:hypothetical protein